MIIYIDRAEVPDVEQIDPRVLQYLIRAAEMQNVRYNRLNDYYLGHHAISRRSPGRDDALVSINYAKYITDITLGYYLGNAVKYDANQHKAPGERPISAANTDGGGPGTANETIDISPIQNAYDAQQISRIDADIGKYMGVMGDCLELCYASDDEVPLPQSAYVDPRNGILVCDSSVAHRKLFALIWEHRRTTSDKDYYFVSVYTDRTVKDYRCSDLHSAVFEQFDEAREHYFGSVPVIAYENNRERQGDFEQIISLIDAYDELMSNRLTDKKKFVDALLVFFGMTLREGDESRLAAEKFLDGAPLDARVEYIQKTLDENSVQVLADALVREMHKMTMTVDMSDESFSGNASGQALKLKLLTMNLLVKNKIQRMEKGLKERFSLYNRWLNVRGDMPLVGVNDIDVVFTVALPINEAEVVQMVTSLQGIVDDQTLLAQLWFIRDPAEAAEAIRKQKDENAQRYGVAENASEEDAEREADRALRDGLQWRKIGFESK